MDIKPINIKDAKIVIRNFSGKEGRYNPPGRRNFCVLLDIPTAEKLELEGWNVRYFEPKDPDDERQPYLHVTVNYNNFPPQVIAINAFGKTYLDEKTINILDWADIETVDLIIRPYSWEVNNKKGIKAYLKKMYVTLVTDEFEEKYRNVPDSAMASLNEEQTPPWD